MVEKTIQKHSQECGKYQLWKKLPKKMMYQTFQHILDYLQESGKIIMDDGVIIWTYNPARINKLNNNGLLRINEMTSKKTIDICGLRDIVVPVLKKHGVRKAGVFGSFARGEATKKSDIDILVDLRKDTSLLEMSSLKIDLEDILRRNVDLVEYSAIMPKIKRHILSEEVALF